MLIRIRCSAAALVPALVVLVALVAVAAIGPTAAFAQSNRDIPGVFRVIVVSEYPRGTNRAAFNERQAQLPAAQRQQAPAVRDDEDLTNSSGTG
ncbi:MAG: hypothetical protein ABL897_08710, partial [Hyphomicrobium sp.]